MSCPNILNFMLVLSFQNLYYNLDMNELNSLYDLIGGETKLRSLVDRFYDIMDSSPEAKDIRAFHAKSLNQSREKLFMFLSGWSGGPALYIEKYGHPRLRQRHMPFSIGEIERDQWLRCMNQALDESGFLPSVVEHLKSRFAEVADFMRNKADGA
jgi:hemoglobin